MVQRRHAGRGSRRARRLALSGLDRPHGPRWFGADGAGTLVSSRGCVAVDIVDLHVRSQVLNGGQIIPIIEMWPDAWTPVAKAPPILRPRGELLATSDPWK